MSYQTLNIQQGFDPVLIYARNFFHFPTENHHNFNHRPTISVLSPVAVARKPIDL